MFSEDLHSMFADMDEGDGEEVELREMKYTPVDTEIDDDYDMIPSRTNLTNDDIDDHCTRGKNKNTPRQEQALSKRLKRAQMSPDEREKLREKWKMEARVRRIKAKQHELTELVGDVGDLSPVKRSTRQAKSRFVMKEEPESAEEDYQVEDENDEDYGSKSKKKGTRKSTPLAKRSPTASRTRISDKKKVEGDKHAPSRLSRGGKKKNVGEMTEEEREATKAKWREEARMKRARQRETDNDEYLRVQREKRRKQRQSGSQKRHSDVECTIKWEEEGEEGGTKTKGGGSSNSRPRAPRRSGSSGRKKVSDMTEEEREIMKVKWREEARLKRARQRETMTLNDREEFLRIQREKRREQRTMAKLTKTEDGNEQENSMIRRERRKKTALMTPEQRKEETQKATIRRIHRMARMTDDEKKMYTMNNYLRNMARMSMLSQEEIAERKRRRQEYTKRRRAQMTAEDLERRRLKLKQYRNNMSPERKERFLTRLREGHRRRMALRRGESDKSDEVKAEMKKEPRTTRRRVVNPNETAEEKVQRIREAKRIIQKKIKLKKKLALQKLLDCGMNMDEIQQKIETPAHRERRLIRIRISKAKLNLRKRLENIGASKDEIKVRLDELEHTYQPTFTTRPYKPRPDCWKPVTAADLALLTEDIKKATQVSPLSMFTSSQPARASSSKSTTTTTTTKSSAPARRGKQPSQRSGLTSTTVKKSQNEISTEIQLQSNDSLPPDQPTCSSSYVTGLETPKPIHYSTHQQQQAYLFQHHQQFVSPQQFQQQQLYNTTTQHHFQTQQLHPHQQPQTQPQQTYVNPLPTSLDNVGHCDTDTTTDHHGDYASSYDNHSPSPSFALGDDDHDYSDGGTVGDLPFQQTPTTTSTTVKKRGRPRKDKPPSPKKSRVSKTGPRTPKQPYKSSGDMVCDECGTAYKHAWRLREHKNQFHNPNYNNQTCQLCGEKFKAVMQWYKHYIRTHVEPTMDMQKKPHMCDVCGISFREKSNLDKHKYFKHGDGSKKENFKRCPVCPTEKLFKENVSLYSHLRKEHPDYNRGGHNCYRCDKTFPDDKELGLHVKAEHDDSYFPCQYCNVCRFTKMGLNFHYVRCTKIPKETRKDLMRKEEGVFSLDRVPLPCEFCKRNVAIYSLTRHYWEMHNVKEDNFSCPDCRKEFRARAFWVVHMEEKHLKTLDQMTDLVRSLNVATREGLDIKNPSGVKGGVPGNTPGKAAYQKRIELGGGVKRGERVKKPKVKRRKGRDQKKQIIVVAAEEEEQEISKKDMKSKKRRHIKVIAEEDDEEDH